MKRKRQNQPSFGRTLLNFVKKIMGLLIALIISMFALGISIVVIAILVYIFLVNVRSQLAQMNGSLSIAISAGVVAIAVIGVLFLFSVLTSKAIEILRLGASHQIDHAEQLPKAKNKLKTSPTEQIAADNIQEMLAHDGEIPDEALRKASDD